LSLADAGAELRREQAPDLRGHGNGGSDALHLRRRGAGHPVGVDRAPEQLAQQPLAVGGDIVGAVVEADGGGVELVQGVEERPADVLVVADDLVKHAGADDVGGGEAGDGLAGWAEEEGRVADDIGVDDQLKAGAFGDDGA
jgi:hypothetical protein